MWKLFIFTCVVYLIKETQTSSVNETVNEFIARSIERMENWTKEGFRRIRIINETFQIIDYDIASNVHNIISEIDKKRREFEEKESRDLERFPNITTCKGIEKKYNFDFNETRECLKINQNKSKSICNHFDINGNIFIDEVESIKNETFKKLKSETLDSLVQTEEILRGAYEDIEKAQENFTDYQPSKVLSEVRLLTELLGIQQKIGRACDPSKYMNSTMEEMEKYIQSIEKCLNNTSVKWYMELVEVIYKSFHETNIPY